MGLLFVWLVVYIIMWDPLVGEGGEGDYVVALRWDIPLSHHPPPPPPPPPPCAHMYAFRVPPPFAYVISSI